MIKRFDSDSFKKKNSYLSEFPKIDKILAENGHLIEKGLMS